MWHDIFTFLNNVPTNAVIVIVVLAFAARDIPGIAKFIPLFRKVDKISDTQDQKYPEMKGMISAMAELTIQSKTLSSQNHALLQNHFKHEIPDMIRKIDKIVEDVADIKQDYGNRLTRVETILDK